jgi:hypothetical protein
VKLWVWKDVLTDYSSGMIVALAPDLETAMAATEQTHEYPSHLREEMGKVMPTVIDLDGDVQPAIWYVHGGG